MSMKYEIVNLQEKKAAGISARTNNSSPDMGAVIGGLWQRFYGEGICPSIPHRVNEKSLGIYTDYAADETGDYTVAAACEVEKTDGMPQGVKILTIPAGRYARFVVKGHMVKAVADCWTELWNMDLPRAFTCDFEEYQDGGVEEAEIHIYISLR